MSLHLSPLAQLVAEQAQTYSDVAREAYAQGKAEGERAAKAKIDALVAALEMVLRYVDAGDQPYRIPINISKAIRAALAKVKP